MNLWASEFEAQIPFKMTKFYLKPGCIKAEGPFFRKDFFAWSRDVYSNIVLVQRSVKMKNMYEPYVLILLHCPGLCMVIMLWKI